MPFDLATQAVISPLHCIRIWREVQKLNVAFTTP